jgi:hypothetical protein
MSEDSTEEQLSEIDDTLQQAAIFAVMARKPLPAVPAWQQMAEDANDYAADAERQLRSAVDSARAAGDLLLQIRKQIGHGELD